MVTNANVLISDVKIGWSPGCSDYTVITQFTILRARGYAKSKARTLNANSQSSRSSSIRPPGKCPSETRERNRAVRSLRMLSAECKS